MHLLYLDDSGSAPNEREQYLVLGGVALHESQALWVTRELDRLASTFNADDPDAVEFHASEIFSGRKKPWSDLPRSERAQVIKEVLSLLAGSDASCCAFACAIHKKSFPSVDHMAMAFEDTCSRFDAYLHQAQRDHANAQCGSIILDESAHESSLQGLTREFRGVGTRWRVIRHLAETPLFLSSAASRIVQLADHVAYAVFRRYEAGDTSYFDVFAHRFFQSRGVVRGLAHKQVAKMAERCMCPACLTQRWPAIDDVFSLEMADFRESRVWQSV